MARQTQNAYEELRETYDLYKNYEIAAINVPQGKHVQNLSQLASLAALKKGEKVLAGNLIKSNNLFELSPWIKPGLEDSKKEFEDSVKKNLEKIIDSTPVKRLQENLLYVAPKKTTKSKYKAIAKLHKEAAEMQMNLGIYTSKSEKISPKLREQALNNIRIKTVEYLKHIYKDEKDNSFLRAFMEYLSVSPNADDEVILPKYSKLAAEKTAEFNKAVKGKVIPYTKAVLSANSAKEFYARVFENDR